MFGVLVLQGGSLWLLLTVESAPCGLLGLMACQGFPVGGACVCVLLCGI